MRSTTKIAALFLLASGSACADMATPVDPSATMAPGGPSMTIYDGAHAAIPYDSKFYFLPPMVSNPKDDMKSADGKLSPVVEVCELTSAGACARVVERFTNVSWNGNHYQANFNAGRYTLNTSKLHRVTVYVNGLTMGWADVVVGRSSRDFRNVDPDKYVTITTSQTLPIKFRIGEGIAAAIDVTPPFKTVKVGEGATFTATVTDLHGKVLTQACRCGHRSHHGDRDDDRDGHDGRGGNRDDDRDGRGGDRDDRDRDHGDRGARHGKSHGGGDHDDDDHDHGNGHGNGHSHHGNGNGYGHGSHGGDCDGDMVVTWTSSDPTIASVDQNGVVTTYRPGTVTITASTERVSDSATLVVEPVEPRVVSVQVEAVTIDIGNTVTLIARAYDENGNLVPDAGPYTWTVRDADGNLVRITSETGEVKGLAAGTALATATLDEPSGPVSGSGTVTVTTDIELATICTTDGLRYFGYTTVLPDGPCGLRLTPAEEWTAGSAWSTTKQPLANGFEVRFGMRMSQPGPPDLTIQGNALPGADGLVFVIQNQGEEVVGNAGVGIGYQGMTSSLAVEFDTWLNIGQNDPSSNHVSVHTNGTGANDADEAYSLGAANIATELYDGLVHEVVIRYVPGTLTVSLDGVVLVTANVTLTNIGGASILDGDGKAWVGFTSATGSAFGIHDVMYWYLDTP